MFYNSVFVYLSGVDHLDRPVLRKAASIVSPEKGFIYALSSYPSSSVIVDVPLSIKHEKFSNLMQNFEEKKRNFKQNVSKIINEVCEDFNLDIVKSELEVKDKAGIQVRFQEGFSADHIKFYGRLADVIVLSKPDTLSFFTSDRMRRFKNAIYHTGRPIFMVPSNRKNKSYKYLQEKHLAVMWNGSNSCARSLTNLNYMFAKSKPKKITAIITKDEVNPKKVAKIFKEKYLRLGIESKIIYLDTRLRYSAKKVLEICDKQDVDTLVTASFSRGGVWKQVFVGGYTKEIIENSNIPLLTNK